jgi:beta-mannosidase
VKRALAHNKLILREDKGCINVICMNDTGNVLEDELEYGYMTFDGLQGDAVAKKITVQPFTKAVVVAQIKKGSHDTLKGLYYARMCKNCGMTPAILRTTDFRNLLVPCPTVKITGINEFEDKIDFVVSSDKYAHGVHFGLDDDILLSDEYFDLLPKESRKITVLKNHATVDIGNINPRYVCVRKGR